MDTYPKKYKKKKYIYVIQGREGGGERNETSAFSHEEKEGVQIGMNCNTSGEKKM